MVGAGAIGASAAYALARDGHEVVVLERGAVGMGASAGHGLHGHGEPCRAHGDARRCCSRASASCPIPPARSRCGRGPRLLPWLARFTAASLTGDAQAGTALMRRLAIESVELHRAWSRELETGLVEAGTLNVYLTEAGLAGREASGRRAPRGGHAGRAARRRPALRERQPAILGAEGAAFYPDDAHVDSLVFTQRVAAAAARLGARVLEGVEVLGVTRGPSRAADRDDERHASRRSASCWRPASGRRASRTTSDVTLPLSGAKGYHVELRGPPGRRAAAGLPVRDARRRDPARRPPAAGGHARARLRPQRARPPARRRGARRRARGTSLASRARRVSHVWRGLRPMSSDGMPIIGRTPRDDRVIVATGHGVLGITLAPAHGRAGRDARGRQRARAGRARPARSGALPPLATQPRRATETLQT